MHRINKLFLSMFLAYFLQKIKKHALQLLGLQGLVIVGLMAHSYFQSLQYESQELEWIQNLGEEYQNYGNFVHQQTTDDFEEMSDKVIEEIRGEIFLGFGKRIRETTHEYIKEIDKTLRWKEKGVGEESIPKDAIHYFRNLKETLFELNDSLYSQDPDLINRIFEDYSPTDDRMKQLKDNPKTAHQIAYLKKTKREIRFMENKVIEHFLGKLDSGGLIYTVYYADIIAPNQLLKGDNYTAKIRYIEGTHMARTAISVGNERLPINADSEAHYHLNTNHLGEHRIEGEVVTKDRYGVTKSYPFTHEYTVLPKCN